MKKQRIGWILALSMVFTQNMGIWAEDLGPENIWEEPAYGEQIRLEELEEDYQDRFIVKYKTESVFRLSEVSPTDLTEAARQAYEKALEDKEQRVAETTVRQEAAAVEDSLSSDAHKFNMEERASVSAEEWKPGYLLFDLEEKIDPERFMEELEAIPGVEYIQPDYELELSDITLELEIIGDTPEESVSPEQTAEPAGIPEDVLGETGNSAETEEPEATEDPSETQEPETEETSEPTAKPLDRMVKAAVIDGGVDVTHEAFTDRITDAWDFTADAELTYDPNRSDQYYHGTHVAGIIAKIAPNADIMPIQVFNQGRAYTSHIIDAIAYAQEHGAEIVNCSWGSTDENPLLKEAMEESDILFICAAGNSRMDIDETQVYPAAYALDNVISVAALNPDQGFSYFSNYGTENVDIAAPGRDVESAWPGNAYGKMSGTSIAAAAVTGGAALASGIGEEDIRGRILNTADRLSNLEEKVQESRVLNLSNLREDIPGEDLTVNPAEDFDVHGYQLTPAETWEQFCSLDTVQVAAGGDFTMVLKGDGTVYAWGDNTNGQLGVENQYASQKERAELGQIPGLSGIMAIAAGPGYALALKSDGTVYAWGDNAYGQLGNGTKTETYVPVQVIGLTGITQISAGRLHGAAVTEDGGLYMWGNNNRGQLGDGTTTGRSMPRVVPGLTDVKSIAAGYYTSFAVLEDGRVMAWGNNKNNELGTNSYTDYYTPVEAKIANVKEIAAGPYHTLALREDGSVYSWGNNAQNQRTPAPDYQQYVALTFSDGMQAIAAGEYHSAFLNENGTVTIYGKNSNGEFGNGTLDDYPRDVKDLTDAVDVAFGYGHGLAVRADGTITAWGNNGSGQLGNGTRLTCKTPRRIGGELSDTEGNGWEDAHAIEDNGSAASVLNTRGDQDWYIFVAGESRKYAIYTTGAVDTYGALYTEAGAAEDSPAAVSNDYGANRNFKIVRELTAGQRYYVQVRGNTDEDLGEYTLRISNVTLNNNSEIIGLTTEADKTITIAAKAENVESFADLAFSLTYDPEKMEVVNLTAQDFEKRTQPGQAGNMEIQSVAPGYIRFRMLDMPEESGMVWKGVLNLFQFHFLGETGDATEIQLDCIQEGGE